MFNATVPYTPYGGVRDLWRCRAPEVCIYAGSGTGKTLGILQKIDLACRKYPGLRVLVCRATRASLTESILVTFETHVADGAIINLASQQRKTRHSYIYVNGSSIVVGGLDNAERMLSTDYDWVYVGEATEAREDKVETLIPRLRNFKAPYQQLILDCNPTHPNHWLKRRMDRGACLGIFSTHKDNPRWWDGEKQEWTVDGVRYLATLERLTGHRVDKPLARGPLALKEPCPPMPG